MSNHVYKSLELTGSSSTNIEDAVSRAVTKASETVHHLRWFEVTDIRGEIENNAVAYWQITMKVGFTLN